MNEAAERVSAALLLVTAPDREVGEGLARACVEEGLAACVNLLPGVRSIYRWQEAVETADEVMLLIKTRSAALPALMQRVGELHPYEVPEMIEVRIDGGSRAYLEWLGAAVTR